MKEIKKELNLIKEYISKRNKVLAAYLYGSYSKGYAKDHSDIDTAILLKETLKRTTYTNICFLYKKT